MSPNDAVMSATMSLVMLAVAVPAAIFPARGATRIDPVRALREDG